MSTAQSLQKSTVKSSELNNDSIGLLQRKCNSCGQHTIAGGSCSRCETQKGVLQKKLMVGSPDDPLEQEADRVADQVMGMETQPATFTTPQRIQPLTCLSSQHAGEAPESVEQVLSSPGTPLEPSLREDMEHRFGHDFSKVRIHTDAAAHKSTLDIQAKAFSLGENIAFGHGQFNPASQDGRRLLAHELTHKIQADTTHKVVARAPDPSSQRKPEMPVNNFTSRQQTALCAVRSRLLEPGDKTGIVGILMTKDGRRWDLHSKGASRTAHVEGKAVDIMNTEGIQEAYLLVEREPCQSCDRTPYPYNPLKPSEGGPEIPLISSKSGKEIPRQLGLIIPRLDKGRTLVVIGPENDPTYYRGIRTPPSGSKPPDPFALPSTSGKKQAAQPARKGETGETPPAKNIPTPSKATIVKKVITGAAIVAGSLTSEPAASAATSAETASIGSNQQAPGASSTRPESLPADGATKAVPPPRQPMQATAIGKNTPRKTETSTGSVPQSGGSSPVLPGRTTTSAVSPAQLAGDGAASKQPIATTTSPKSTATTRTPTSLPTSAVMNDTPTAIGAALGLANELVKAELQAISEEKAHSAAWNDYYESIHGIMDELWERPGEGAAIEFKFIHIRHPQDILPDSTEYAGMQNAIGANPYIRVPFNPTMEAGRDINPANVRSESIRCWIPPVRPAAPKTATSQHDTTKSVSPHAASSQATAAQPVPARKPLILISTAADFVKYVKVRPDLFVGTSLDAYDFLNSGVTIMNGYEIIRPEAIYIVPHDFRMVLLNGLRDDLTQHLSQRVNELKADIRFHENRLSSFLQEGWPFTIRRGDIDLRRLEHMFDSPKAHHAAARGMIGTGAFRQALESLERGEIGVAQNKKILYHYEKGIPYQGPD